MIFLFALLHDTMRENEHRDPGHGPRAAAFALELYESGLLGISGTQLEQLTYACAEHADGLVSSDPTVAACWDADRLDLPRVGIMPRPDLFSTELARTVEVPTRLAANLAGAAPSRPPMSSGRRAGRTLVTIRSHETGGTHMPAPTLVVGAPCWIDLYSSDTDKAKEFYGKLFGWTPEEAPPEFGGYFTFLKDGKHVAGCMHNDGSQNAPDSWTVHLMTDDIDRTVEDARKNGGQVFVEPMAVGDNGRFAMIGDPGQAGIGAWEPASVKGFEIRNEPGAAAWFELHTRAYDKSVAFYRDVFGWDTHTMSDTPEFRYTTQGEGDNSLAGIYESSDLAEGEPAAWTVYFDVEDVDAALEKIVELGGTIERPGEDTPYGRLAAATDPTGTRFKLIQTERLREGPRRSRPLPTCRAS